MNVSNSGACLPCPYYYNPRTFALPKPRENPFVERLYAYRYAMPRPTESPTQNFTYVLFTYPGEVWPEVFKYTNQSALPGVVLLARALLEREVRDYRSGVYLVQGLEPATLGHLSPHSAVRGLTEFFRKQVLHFHTNIINYTKFR